MRYNYYMDVEKILVDQGKYSLVQNEWGQASKKIESYYKDELAEVLEIPDEANEAKFQVYKSKGDGIVVSRLKEVDDGEGKLFIPDLKVTFRKKGGARIDDPNQQTILSAGIKHTYYGVCNTEGTITFHTTNDTEKIVSEVERMLNANTWPNLNTREIANKYRDAISTAIGVLGKLPQT